MKNDPLWVSVVDCFNDSSAINVFQIAAGIAGTDAEKFTMAQKFQGNLTRLKNINEKDMPALMIPASAKLEEAIDIFDLVNSQGTKLTDAELALTHVVGKWPLARRVIKEKLKCLTSKTSNSYFLSSLAASLQPFHTAPYMKPSTQSQKKI
jgi:hypothetical protein